MKTAPTRFLPVLVGFLPLFGRFVPVFVSYFQERILRAWKTEGLICDYGTRTIRIGKFHYKIDMSIVLTTEQVRIMLDYLGTEVLRRLKI